MTNTNSAFNGMLSAIDRGFYFGIGGIGDFLLLMASVKHNSFDVLFVANSTKPIQALADTGIFPGLRRLWLFPKTLFTANFDTWLSIVNHPMHLGHGVTPHGFNYIADWNECGKSTVFDYYGVNKSPGWLHITTPRTKYAFTVIQPFGGADDPTKVKQMSRRLLEQLVCVEYAHSPITFIGSPTELDTIKKMHLEVMTYPPTYVSDMTATVNAIQTCEHFIGVDSWGKTFAGLDGVPNITVYKNKYINGTPRQLFGQDIDPSDFVFLDNWGFNMKDDPYDA